jgi:GDP-L-fucose synthase
VSISELAGLISSIAGFSGQIIFDSGMPDGTPRKLLDISRLKALGWQPETSLEAGIGQTYTWMVEHWSQVDDE